MNQPQREEVLYLVAVRTPLEPGNGQHTRVMEAVRQSLGESIPLKAEDTTVAATVTLYSELTANHHGYLCEFGFPFEQANRLITVASGTQRGG